MKYMIITNHSYMLWRFRKELIAELMTRGEVVISTPFVGHENDFMNMGCRCIETKLERRGINPIKDFELYQTYINLLKQEKPDLVITYSIKPNVYAGYACTRLNIPYYVNVQGLGTAFQKEPMATIATTMYRIALHNAKKVFFENETNASEFIKRKIVKSDHIKVLHGAGVNLNDFTYQEFPEEDHKIHILFLGRIMKEKGVDELFEAAKKIKRKYKDQVVFDLVGFFEDGYKEKVRQLEKDNVIVFHGFQEDPMPYYKKAQCVVLPSYHEGMSNVVLEAAASGRCIISTNIPGCKEAVLDGISGLLCKKKNTESLYKALDKFIQLSHDEKKQMGLAGRKHMEAAFDKDKVVEITMKHLCK